MGNIVLLPDVDDHPLWFTAQSFSMDLHGLILITVFSAHLSKVDRPIIIITRNLAFIALIIMVRTFDSWLARRKQLPRRQLLPKRRR